MTNVLVELHIKEKFLLHNVKERLILQYKLLYTFLLQCFFDEPFQFDFPANDVLLCDNEVFVDYQLSMF